MVVRVSCDIGKGFLKDTSFEMNKFPKMKLLNFRKYYDSEGATQLLLRSDHFVNPTV